MISAWVLLGYDRREVSVPLSVVTTFDPRIFKTGVHVKAHSLPHSADAV